MSSIRNARLAVATGVLMAGLASTPVVHAGAEPFIGEIMWVGFNFCPRGFAEMDGQLLSISQNPALFSLLGTMYGGDGQTTFALPDLRGRTMVHVGQGLGLSNINQGEVSGAEDQTLTFAKMPAHSHTATTTISDLKITSTLRGSTQTHKSWSCGKGAWRRRGERSRIRGRRSGREHGRGFSAKLRHGRHCDDDRRFDEQRRHAGAGARPLRRVEGLMAVEGIYPSRP